MKFSIVSFGCKVNQYQAQILRESMVGLGFHESKPKDADVVLVNGCLVTQRAQAEGLRAAEKYKNNSIIIATGCAGAGENFSQFMRLPPNNLDELPSLLNIEGTVVSAISKFKGHTRAMIAVQYGCSNFCSYCIVPSLRGKPRSREIPEIVSEAETLANSGHPELVLCGTELGHFEKLPELLKKLSPIKNLKRIRLSSINPRHLTLSLVSEILSIPKVAPHLHLPLQSGSNEILEKMKRGYTREHFISLVASAKKTIEDVGITTDIIIGFPGETEENFEETLSLMKESHFHKCHIFPFSPRPNTPAFDMKRIQESFVTNRAKIARDLANRLALQAINDNIGKLVRVLVEQGSGGFTGTYLRMKINGDVPKGSLVKCTVTGVQGNELIGELA